MTKPILWLGPLEDVDVDYDPLLGRSAKDPIVTATFARPSNLAPDRSVFDEPDVAQTAPALLEPQPDPEEPVVPGIVEEVPPPEFLAQPFEQPISEPTDFSHNNDAIPERLAPPPEEAPTPPTPAPVEMDGEPEVAPPTKSFLTRLFASKPIVATATTVAATTATAATTISALAPSSKEEAISEPAKDDFLEPIEAETTHEPNEQAEAHDSKLVEDIVEDRSADLDVAPELVGTEVSEVDEGVRTKTSLDTQVDAETLADDGSTLDPPIDDVAISISEPVETKVETADEPTPEIEPVAQSEPTSENEHTVETAPESDDLVSELSETEQESQAGHTSTKDGTPEEASLVADTFEPDARAAPEPARDNIHPFSRAFNSDKFWSVSDARATDEGETALEDQVAPEPSAPELASLEETLQSPEPALKIGADDRPIETSDANLAPSRDAQTEAGAPKPRKARRRKKQKKNYVGAFFGTFIFGIALVATLVSGLAAFGYPFDLASSYRWYWITMAIVAAGIWGLSRGWKMVGASFLVAVINLFVTIPTSGDAPVGGKMASAVIGWANLSAQPEALTKVIKDADAKGATLLMLAEAPSNIAQPIAGWTLIEAPIPNDPTAIAVLSKGSWRAATVPGEPTMARPPAGDITIIGVHPKDANKARRSTPARDALINRAATRAGSQEGPTVVLGDFNASPWDGAMRQFKDYGKVTRVRCGGWTAGTYNQVFGLISVATDHAYVRDVKVTHCRLGLGLPGGPHKPIWLYVAPLQAAGPATP
jgi:hypothetical protein